jgi:hypothetical protein
VPAAEARQIISARRRGHGEDAIHFDAAKNRHIGAVALGFGPDEKAGLTPGRPGTLLLALHELGRCP